MVPVGPATALFSEAFLIACRDRMSSRSLLVRQNGVPFLQPKQYIDGHRMLSSVFENSGSYFTIVPTYQGGYLSIGWAAIGMTRS